MTSSISHKYKIIHVKAHIYITETLLRNARKQVEQYKKTKPTDDLGAINKC